jgi:outer membrane lipoprotein LolB
MFSGQCRLWTIVAVAVLMASCASRPPVSLPGEAADPGALSSWRMDGKLGFRSPEKNGSAWVNWVQRGSAYQLQLNGPFGAASTRIVGDRDHAILSQSGREDIAAATGEELTEWLFGWAFPVSEMAWWIKGLPAPNTRVDKLTRAADGRLASLEQQGWSLVFSDFSEVDSWVLPGRIRGSRGPYAFTLVINTWRAE